MKYDHGVITDYLNTNVKKMQQHYEQGNPIAILLSLIEAGATYEIACDNAGIDESNFHQWKKGNVPVTAIGAESEEELEEAKNQFSQSIRKADSIAENTRVKRINEAGKAGNWQADAWWLERRKSERYGKKDSVEVTNKQAVEKTTERLAGWMEGEDIELIDNNAGNEQPTVDAGEAGAAEESTGII